MSPAVALVFAAGCAAAVGLVELAAAAAAPVRRRLPRLAGEAASLLEALMRVGREGRAPGAAERRRLLAAGAVLAFAGATFVAGPLVGLAAAALGPGVVSRLLLARRRRYQRAVDTGAPVMALGLADALGGGHSLRGAIGEAAAGLEGAAGHELRRVAAELDLGVETDEALEGMRARVRSQSIDTIVGAALLQRRAGGDLARLLRDCARSFEDQARLEQEVRAATAQARFTGLIVVLLPLGGGLLAELASPGFFGNLADSFLTAWLVGLAVAMQAVAAVAIRRLGRVRG